MSMQLSHSENHHALDVDATMIQINAGLRRKNVIYVIRHISRMCKNREKEPQMSQRSREEMSHGAARKERRQCKRRGKCVKPVKKLVESSSDGYTDSDESDALFVPLMIENK